jgi:LmbE family N-acetylglucosaminyl deacetylase
VSVLAIVAHADDEVLGAGGTLARLAHNGEVVDILILADGVGARGSVEGAARRAEAARRAAACLGARDPIMLGLQDNRLDSLDLLDITQQIERVLEELRPRDIYTHHAGDLNIDHAICHRAVLTAARPIPGRSVRRIYAMEIASSTEWAAPGSHTAFVPSRFVDISGFINQKRLALEAYAEEMRPFPHARSFEAVEALARWRGATAGMPAAEAFVVIRDLEA